LVALRQGEAQNAAVRVRTAVDEMFDAVQRATGVSVGKGQFTVRQPLGMETSAPDLIRKLCLMVRHIHDDLDDLNLRAELAAARRRGEELAASLDAFLKQMLPDHVYWVALEGSRRKQLVLYSAPVEVGPVLAEMLFAKVRTVVMTSATLAVNKELSYFKQRVGAESADAAVFGSPFDFERQMKLLLPRGMPEPNSPEFAEAAARSVFCGYDRGWGLRVVYECEILARFSQPYTQSFRETRLSGFCTGGRNAAPCDVGTF
jgi:ATP-dependent DNA helicase DinG